MHVLRQQIRYPHNTALLHTFLSLIELVVVFFLHFVYVVCADITACSLTISSGVQELLSNRQRSPMCTTSQPGTVECPHIYVYYVLGPYF